MASYSDLQIDREGQNLCKGEVAMETKEIVVTPELLAGLREAMTELRLLEAAHS